MEATELVISSPKYGTKVVLISPESVSVIERFNWHILKDHAGRFRATTHVGSGKSRFSETLHRMVMGCQRGDGKIVDHINRNTLDNRLENLRFVTHRENRQNSDTFQGYSQQPDGSFLCRINFGGRSINIGRFQTKEESIEQHKKAENLILSGCSYEELISIRPIKEHYAVKARKEGKVLTRRSPDPHRPRSKYRGLSWTGKKWRAQIYDKGKIIYLGEYHTEEEAYDAILKHRS